MDGPAIPPKRLRFQLAIGYRPIITLRNVGGAHDKELINYLICCLYYL